MRVDFFLSSNFQLKWDRCAIVAHPTAYVSSHFDQNKSLDLQLFVHLSRYSNEIVIQIGWYACEAGAMCVHFLDKCFIWRRMKPQQNMDLYKEIREAKVEWGEKVK